jgi:hypothetical protein
MDENIKLMREPVRAQVGGRMMTVWLSDFEASNGTYNGFAVTVGKDLDSQRNNPGWLNGIEFRPVVGYRKYPANIPRGETGEVQKQFVLMGEDESVLSAITNQNIADGQSDTVTQDLDTGETTTGDPNQARADEAHEKRDLNKDGVVTKAERQQYRDSRKK